MVSSSPERLIPRWYAATVVGGLVVFTLALVVTSTAFGEGLAGASMWGLATCSALVLVAACSALLRPRRPRDPEVTADGTRVFRSPSLTVWPLVGAWVALLVTATVWGWLALTDFDALESPGFSLITVVGALASLPDLVRLLTGRLHRWTVAIGPEQLTYRGYRTDLTVPWKDVHGAVVQERGPAGVRIDLRGDRPDPVVPVTAFDVPAEQVVEEIIRARKAARR
ncbi:hypothetical protein [Nocardioides sp.]|uniref:hypothetical protein n=1 Tax=Nocardioides sp. TaxID=35761 RepID=UPI0035B40FA2